MKPSRFIVCTFIVPVVPSKEMVDFFSEIVRLSFEEQKLYIGSTLYPCSYGNTIVFYCESDPMENLILPIN